MDTPEVQRTEPRSIRVRKPRARFKWSRAHQRSNLERTDYEHGLNFAVLLAGLALCQATLAALGRYSDGPNPSVEAVLDGPGWGLTVLCKQHKLTDREK